MNDGHRSVFLNSSRTIIIIIIREKHVSFCHRVHLPLAAAQVDHRKSIDERVCLGFVFSRWLI